MPVRAQLKSRLGLFRTSHSSDGSELVGEENPRHFPPVGSIIVHIDRYLNGVTKAIGATRTGNIHYSVLRENAMESYNLIRTLEC